MTILEKIISYKREEVRQLAKRVPISILEESSFFQSDCISLKQQIQQKDKSGIIAEFKRQSPSKGIINETAIVSETVKGYLDVGASGVSILTDTKSFGGKNEDVIAAKKKGLGPILRKDFTISEYQIIEAKSIGADAILLIAAVLSKNEIQQFTSLAHNLGLEVLLEVHTQEELNKYIPEINLVGINNRDLNTFQVDFENSIRLAAELPSETIKIAESGISDFKNIIELKKHDFKGFLIGENFMKTSNPALACQQFIEQINNVTHA